MSIRFGCDSCGQHLAAEPDQIGQTVTCPQCGKRCIVPPTSTLPNRAPTPAADITFNCDKCGQSLTIDEAGAGQLVDCPKCGTPLEVPYKSKTAGDKKCPFCAKTIKEDAKICRHCGRLLGLAAQDTSRMERAEDDVPKPTQPPIIPPGTDTKECPFCAETIKKEAKVCRFCGRQLVTGTLNTAGPPVMQERSGQNMKVGFRPSLVVVIVLLVLVCAILTAAWWSFSDALWSFSQPVYEYRTLCCGYPGWDTCTDDYQVNGWEVIEKEMMVTSLAPCPIGSTGRVMVYKLRRRVR